MSSRKRGEDLTAGTYSKLITVVTGGTITASERNNEHDNHINNATPTGIDDDSTNVAAMQVTVDPYPAAAESLATDLHGEIARLRYVIAQITGEANWYVDPDYDLQGPILPADGTVSLPAFAFANEPDCGLYVIGTNNIGIATAGVKAVDIGSSSQVAIRGTTTNDSAAAGFVGEHVIASVGATAVPTTTELGDLTSISLTAGDWDVSGSVWFTRSTATWSAVEMGISITAGNNATGLTNGSNRLFGGWASTSTAIVDVSLTVAAHRLSLASTTTIYLKFGSTYTVNTPSAQGRISARRVR